MFDKMFIQCYTALELGSLRLIECRICITHRDLIASFIVRRYALSHNTIIKYSICFCQLSPYVRYSTFLI